MEYCAVQAPLYPIAGEVERCDVQKFGKLVLAAVFIGESMRETQIINLLADNFLPAVMNNIMEDEISRYWRSAVKSAFTEMDRLVKEKLKVDRSTEDLTALCVVDLPNKVVYSMGSFLKAQASIVSHDSSIRRAGRLKPGDRHLVIATRRLMLCMVGDIGAVLETRIRQVGLVEACKSIVGKYMDMPKTLIVITLREDAHLPYSDQPQLPAAGAWEGRLRRKLQVLGLGEDEDDDDDDLEMARCFYTNPLAHVRPLREGETCQQPEPYATVLYSFIGAPPLGTIEIPLVSEGLQVNKEPERQEAVEANKKTEPPEDPP